MKINTHPKDIHIKLSDISEENSYAMAFTDETDSETINPNYLDDESLDRAIMLTYTAYRMLKDRKDNRMPIPALKELDIMDAPDNQQYTF